MRRLLTALVLSVLAALALTGEALAQAGAVPQWRPPTREMPAMPTMAELQGDWMATLGTWFRGVDQVAGVSTARLRATGEAARGSERAAVVRFSSGPVPVAVWSDRNGDGRLDLLELYRAGAMVLQLIDADYDGRANVLRIHDASGAFVREERLNR